MTYAFRFDSSGCSGCKACQAACKDKNNLPAGVFWRRVIEVSGGDWAQENGAWVNTVFVYNLSMACNHCVHPKCAGVCPVDAYTVRPDGIVLLDSARCVGCGYCNWACPYAVPQYDPAQGVMGKCNFCFDALEAGQQPSCAAACPLRVLEVVKVEESPSQPALLPLWEIPGGQHPFPLPEFSRTQPHILLRPHPAMHNELAKRVANREELRPPAPKSEMPLVFFTLITQAAVGVFWSAGWTYNMFLLLLQTNSSPLWLVPYGMVGILLAMALLISFAHLGRKRNAWRVLANLKKSWLSREILSLGAFGLAVLVYIVFRTFFSALLAALAGLVVITSMANVYRLRSMPAWNNSRTLGAFLLSALLLGQNLLLPVQISASQWSGITLPVNHYGALHLFSVLLLGVQAGLMLVNQPAALAGFGRTRLVLIGATASALLVSIFAAPAARLGMSVLVLALLLAQEVLGRIDFYSAIEERRL